MEGLNSIPDWLGEAVLAAVAASVGFFGKSLLEALGRRRRKAADRLSAVRVLNGLLEDSKSVFASQNYLARRLMDKLRKRYPDEVKRGLGFDETFFRLSAKMDEEERELQMLIRSTTMNSMRSLNEALRTWLRNHREFRDPFQQSQVQREFAEDLQQLELHLNQWFDKFEAFIPRDTQRSLVYLADEKRQGIGFPSRIAASVRGVIRELS